MNFTKPRTANSAAAAIIFFLMMATCAKEKNEDNSYDEEESYTDAMYGRTPEEIRAFSIADWKRFQKESASMISITENNLRSLQVKIVNTSENNKVNLRSTYADCSTKLNRLKDRLDTRNAEFKTEVEEFDDATVVRNSEFKEKFKTDISDLNLRLEKVIEQSLE